MERRILEHYFIASPKVLGVKTNLPSFKWSFGMHTPPSTAEEYDACALRIRLDVVPDSEFGQNGLLPKNAQVGKYHYFRAVPGQDSIIYERPFLFSSQLLLQVSGLLSGEPHIRANRSYHRYVSHRFMNLHSVSYIVTDITALALLRKGFAALHCSAFKVGDRTVVVFAPPNTGKTLTTMTACMDHGADFLAEDLAISDGVMLYPVPWTSTFRYYSKVETSLGARLGNALTKLVPIVELLPVGKRKPVTHYIDSTKIAPPSRITDVVVLERGDEQVVRCSPQDALGKLANLNRFEFWYHKSPLITAYEYFNPDLDVAGAAQTEKRLLLKIAENARQVLVVRALDPSRFASLTLDALG
ncbi:MAG: hypothetical protein QHI38_11420 [Armatimonadota bacterium]|nr:hypothetical protein [Armatimonadota bacterium]